MGVAVSVSNPEKSSGEEGGRRGHPGPGLSSQAAQDAVQGTVVLPPWPVHGSKSSESGPPALAQKIHARTYTHLAATDTKDLQCAWGPTAGEGRAKTEFELQTLWLQRLCTLSFINCLHFLNVQLSNEIACKP